MNSSSATLVLAAHLAVLSSISFGGFPTVLPDVHNFAVAKGWVTDQEFANFFAVSQVMPGPNMILMMSFLGLQGRRHSGGDRQCARDLRAALRHVLPFLPAMGPLPRYAMAAHRAAWACSSDDRARHCRRLCDGSFRRCRVAECSDHRCCSGTDARHTAQSALDPDRRRSIGRARTSLTASSMSSSE